MNDSLYQFKDQKTTFSKNHKFLQILNVKFK